MPLFNQRRYVEGGMGSISKAIASAAVAAGAHVATNAEVCHQESLLVSKFTFYEALTQIQH